MIPIPAVLCDYGAEAWLAALLGVTAPITQYYIALCSDEPGVASDGTILADLEPILDPTYARRAYGVGADNWGLNGAYATNLNEVDFGTPSVDWGLIDHFALCTAVVDGDLYGAGEFMNPQFVSVGFDLVVPPGGLVLNLAIQDNSITV